MVTEVTKIILTDKNEHEATSEDPGVVQAAFNAAGFASIIRLIAPESEVEFTAARPSPAQAGQIFSAVRGQLGRTKAASLETVQTETMALTI